MALETTSIASKRGKLARQAKATLRDGASPLKAMVVSCCCVSFNCAAERGNIVIPKPLLTICFNVSKEVLAEAAMG